VTRLFCTAVLLLPLLACAPITDERWEGEAFGCSDNVADFDVIMLLNRAGSSVPGYAGFKNTGSEDNYSVTLIEDPEYGPGTLKFTASFDSGSSTDDWVADLTSEGGKYEGELEVDLNGNTVRCDVELKPAE